ncbi:LamG-like jellyroll fold domain-containing protein [Patescibacteria group bacterium]
MNLPFAIRKIIGLLLFLVIVFLEVGFGPLYAQGPDFSVDVNLVEVIFDWNTQRCNDSDIPDSPVRAFIDDSGNVQFIGSFYQTRRFIGDNLTDVNHECEMIFRSHVNADPEMYDDYEWIRALYTFDGQTIYGLDHNEYHGYAHSNCYQQDLNNCWWNSVNLIKSTDSGQSYSHLPAPSHNIINSPVEFNPNNTQGNVGYFHPSNIIEKNGYYYSLLEVHNPPQPQKTCLMRTTQAGMDDPQSWRLWDGVGFSADVGKTNCTGLVNKPYSTHLSYNTYFEKYLTFDCNWNTRQCHYALSDDLINWSQTQVLPLPVGFDPCAYGTLVQPGVEGRNFEQTGRSPWLYYVQCDDNSCSPGCGTVSQDLRRSRLRFNKAGEEHRYELLDLQMNEIKGSRTLDSSFYVNDGFLNGGVSFAQDGGRNMTRFDGSGYIRVPDSASLNVFGKMTLEVNLRTSAVVEYGDYQVIVNKDDFSVPGSGLRNYGLFLTYPGKLYFSIAGDGQDKSGFSQKTINDGQWHNLKVIYDNISGFAHFFIDDEQDSSHYFGLNLESGFNSRQVIIGDGFNGDIDSVTIHNYLNSPPVCDTSWEEVGSFSGVGCNQSFPASFDATAVKMKMVGGGGTDGRISFYCCGSGGASWLTGSGEEHQVTDQSFALERGEVRYTAKFSEPQNFTSHHFSVGCSDSETMDVLVESCQSGQVPTPPPLSPDCTDLRVLPSQIFTQGEVVTLEAQATFTNPMRYVEFHLAPLGSDYCEASNWTFIGDTFPIPDPDNWWSMDWDTSLPPPGGSEPVAPGDYMLIVKAIDTVGEYCSGNPSASVCGLEACSDCSQVMTINPASSPPTPTPDPLCRANVDPSGSLVDVGDFLYVFKNWSGNFSGADITEDNKVNSIDLSWVIKGWGKNCP